MDNKKLIRSASVVGLFVMCSRVFGLVRDQAMAAFFGGALVMDAFVVASTIPNLFRNLFGEGALSAAFVPVFTESMEKQKREEVWQFASRMMTLLGIGLASIVMVGIALAALVQTFVPLSPRELLISHLLQIMLPYMFFICMAALFSGMLNSLRRFVLPAATPVILNVVMIAALFLVCPRLDAEGSARITAVAWSVVVAGAIQWLIQLPPLMTAGFRPKFSMDWTDPRVRRVGTLMGAAILGMGMNQINVVLDRWIAVLTGEGGPSYLYFAERLIYLPLGLFGVSLGTVLLPTLSAHVTQNRIDQVRETVNHSLRILTFIMLPAAVGLFVLGEPIVRLIYERGKFTPLSTDMTTWALQCYAPGLLVFSMLKVFLPVFYAHQDMKTPVRVSMWCIVLNIVLKLILMWPMKHAGIALATVLSSTVNVVVLAVLAHRLIGSPGWVQLAQSFLRMLAAVTVMALAAGYTHHTLANAAWLQPLFNGLVRQIIAVGASIGIAALVYAGAAAAFRCTELREFTGAILARRKKMG